MVKKGHAKRPTYSSKYLPTTYPPTYSVIFISSILIVPTRNETYGIDEFRIGYDSVGGINTLFGTF